MNISDEIRNIIVSHTGVDFDSISDNAEICADLGATELMCVRIMIDVEKRFDITIPDEVMGDLSTVCALERYVADKLNK